MPVSDYVKQKFDDFVGKTVLDYEDQQLEKKFDDFRYLMKEYHDGILLFELTDKMVWSKAIQDTIGLQNFYELNKTKYMWDKRVEASIYSIPNQKFVEATKKLAEKRFSKWLTPDEMLLKFIKITKNDESQKITVEDGLFNKGDNPMIDETEWIVGKISKEYEKNGKYSFVTINKIIEPTPKSIKEAKGLITADYQTFLETEWIKSLREKYSVELNNDVLHSIK
jgi:peptidyl-prolyl cis-trans isomerase SurA